MELTQATTPAPAQVSEPVRDPETALHDRFVNLVRDTPENDPHAGTDLEAPKPEQADPEKTEPETTEPEAEIEIDDETPIFELEIKKTGEKKKLSLKELREGYLAKEDYHRNIQQVKQQEKQLQEQVKTAQVEATKQYVQQLEAYKQALVKTIAPEVQNVDLNKLSMEDPAEAQRLFFKQLQFNQLLQGIQSEQKAAFEKMEGERKQMLSEAVQKARETLQQKDWWSDEKYQTLLKAGVEEYGFKPDEVAQWVDPRVIELLHDASEYRSLKKAKPEVQKKVVAVPKVVKPGSADKPNPSADAETEARARLKKTGSVDAAVAAYLARQKRR